MFYAAALRGLFNFSKNVNQELLLDTVFPILEELFKAKFDLALTKKIDK